MELSPEIAAFIERQRVGRFATVDAAGMPHVVPVCFTLLNGRCYIAIDEKPKRTARLQRLKNIEGNSQVALVLDEYSEDWSRLAWVMIRGQAEILEHSTDHPVALTALRAKYPQYRAMTLEDRPVIRITPERVNAWGLAGRAPSAPGS